ncbi:MAG TPA: DUF3147 family protein [Acidimicrobiales bacterium]|nr:DUF3147 family protein [Acidimicrobiales bacterium]
MEEMAQLATKTVAGGALVVAFALIGEAARPKRFSGLFSSAPAVALASLIVTVVAKGTFDARSASLGMIAGSVAMVACCVVAVRAVPSLHVVPASALVWATWLVVSFGLYGAARAVG